jgi:hypothetical protein
VSLYHLGTFAFPTKMDVITTYIHIYIYIWGLSFIVTSPYTLNYPYWATYWFPLLCLLISYFFAYFHFPAIGESGNRGIGVSGYRGIVCRCAATIIVGTAATLRWKWRSFRKVLVNHHQICSNCNTSRVNRKLIFTKNAPGSPSLSSDFRKMISFKSLL